MKQMEVDTEPQCESFPSGFCAFSEQELTSYVLTMTPADVEPPQKPDEPGTTQGNRAVNEYLVSNKYE